MTPPLEPWGQSDIPQPPAYSLKNAVRVIGPGTILLAVSLGSGDWLLGPAVTARYGPGLLWLCAVSIVLQALLNTEMARYTLATGEPIWSGFMRTRPGVGCWGWSYALLHWLQLGWPGWALAGGTALAAAFLGRMPRAEDRPAVLFLGYRVFLGAIAIVLWDRRIRYTIERLEPALFVSHRRAPPRAGPPLRAVAHVGDGGPRVPRPGGRRPVGAPGTRLERARLGPAHRLRRLLGGGRHHQRHPHLLAPGQGLRHGGHHRGRAV